MKPKWSVHLDIGNFKLKKQLGLLSSKQIEKLFPSKDDEEIVRIYGRIKETPLFDFNRKHPVSLPRDHGISALIVKQTHEDIYHPGYLRVMAEARKKFWIIGIRYLSKSIGRNCIICRRSHGTNDVKLIPGHPFGSTAIDYFGPFEIKYGSKGRKKCSGAVFTCLTTRAVQGQHKGSTCGEWYILWYVLLTSASMEHLKGSTVTMAAILLVQPKNYEWWLKHGGKTIKRSLNWEQ